jgi:hypothetical protein
MDMADIESLLIPILMDNGASEIRQWVHRLLELPKPPFPASRILAHFLDVVQHSDIASEIVQHSPEILGDLLISLDSSHRKACADVYACITEKAQTENELAGLVCERLLAWDAWFSDSLIPDIDSVYGSSEIHVFVYAEFIRVWMGFASLRPANYTQERLQVIIQAIPRFMEKKVIPDEHLELLAQFILAFDWVMIQPYLQEMSKTDTGESHVRLFADALRKYQPNPEESEFVEDLLTKVALVAPPVLETCLAERC